MLVRLEEDHCHACRGQWAWEPSGSVTQGKDCFLHEEESGSGTERKTQIYIHASAHECLQQLYS